VKSVAPVLAAGSTFAVATLAGLFAGVWIGHRTGQPLWVPAGLLAGLGLGAFSAFRLLMRSL
jgi:uncharacterized protein YneF (UPF0154 family)